MSWSQAQKDAIFQDYWQNRSSRCPECDAIIRFNKTDLASPAGYWLLAQCPKGHGDMRMSRNDDPLRDQFHKWTDEELSTLLDQYFENGSVDCPNDGNELSIDEQAYHGGNQVTAACERCGVLHRKNYPRQ